jgi:hypothetical protein
MAPDLPQTEIAIVEMTNAFRKASALQEVKPNPVLAAAARAFAEYLAKSGKFGHEADGRAPDKRAEAGGYQACMVAENLAWNADSRGFQTRQLAGEILEGWKDSPPHRENLLLPEATEIGVAIVPAPYKIQKFVTVQLFGRPRSEQIRFTIRNTTRMPIRYSVGREMETLDASTSVDYGVCDLEPVTFERKIGAPIRFTPRNGDRFVVRAGDGPAFEVDVVAK